MHAPTFAAQHQPTPETSPTLLQILEMRHAAKKREPCAVCAYAAMSNETLWMRRRAKGGRECSFCASMGLRCGMCC